MFVACSTLCFGRFPFDQALRIIGDLEFAKMDLAIHEQGPHLRPSEVAADVNRAVQRIRLGSSTAPAAFSVQIDAPNEKEYLRQLQAVCRLARLTAVPLISVPAASSGSGLDDEVQRLTPLVKAAAVEGVILTVECRLGTLTEMPGTAAELCQRVPGLGLAFDPSPFVAGPNQGKCFDVVCPHVQHVRLRDTGRSPEQFQLRIGQGEIEYGKIITQLGRFRYDRALTVDIRDIPDAPFAMEPEVRKLKYLLESLV